MEEQISVPPKIPIELRLTEAKNLVLSGVSKVQACKRANVNEQTLRRLFIEIFVFN